MYIIKKDIKKGEKHEKKETDCGFIPLRYYPFGNGDSYQRLHGC